MSRWRRLEDNHKDEKPKEEEKSKIEEKPKTGENGESIVERKARVDKETETLRHETRSALEELARQNSLVFTQYKVYFAQGMDVGVDWNYCFGRHVPKWFGLRKELIKIITFDNIGFYAYEEVECYDDAYLELASRVEQILRQYHDRYAAIS